MNRKSVSIWGCSGTIGRKAFEVALEKGYKVVALIGNSCYNEIIRQAKLSVPRYVGVADAAAFDIVKESLCCGETSVVPLSEFRDLATLDVDCCVMAISGTPGLDPSFSCLGHAKRLAIATKEVIISGGNLLRQYAIENMTEIIPIDSEHSAIFQCLENENEKKLSEIILTASGGPFRDLEESDLKHVTIENALMHPNWNMGRKITVDSATMINKALEIIEASYLFNFPIERIKPLIHLESIIHGIVKFCDNSYKASMAYPDMKLPISYAMTYPERSDCRGVPDLNFEETLGQLTFRKPKAWQNRNMNLAYESFRENKVIAFNRANEIAVRDFLGGKLKFRDIYGFIVSYLERSPSEKNINSLDDIIELISFRN